MNACVALTVFAVMFGIGLGVAPREFREAWRRPGPMLRALCAVLVVVPVIWAAEKIGGSSHGETGTAFGGTAPPPGRQGSGRQGCGA